VKTQFPVVISHVSIVQITPSLQILGVLMHPNAGSHLTVWHKFVGAQVTEVT
jgi:hypothetical protein